MDVDCAPNVGVAMQGKDLSELRSFPLFSDLPEAVLRQLERSCILRDYTAGQVMVSHLDDDADVYFVLAGIATVRVYSSHGRVVSFRRIGRGEIFGEFAALDNAPRSASVEAETDIRAAIIPAAPFRQFVDEVPAFSRKLLCHLVGQVRMLTARVVELSTMAVNGRIEAELVRIAELVGRRDGPHGKKIRINVLPTQCDLASRIGTHREAVSRHLSFLVREGIIRREGRALVIEDVDRLSFLTGNSSVN